MRRYTVLLIVLGAGSGVGQDAVRQDPIHETGQIFTADEFREHLQAFRDRRTAVNQVQNMLEKVGALSPEQHKELMDFAQRLMEKSQAGGDKKELKIPPSLLRNPQIQKMLNDEKFLEQLLENKALMDLAERLVERYRLPDNLPNGQGQRPGGANAGPGQKGRRPGSPQRQPGVPQTGGPNQPGQSPAESPPNAGARSETSEPTSLGQGERQPTQPGQGIAPEPKTATSERNGNNRRSMPGGQRGQGEPSELDPGRKMLKDATDAMRRLGLKESQTLDRLEERLSGERSPGGGIRDLSPPPLWEELQKRFEETPLSNWTDELVDNRFADMLPLPSGWNEWLPKLGSLPILSMPKVDLGWMSPPIPAMPNVDVSIPSGRQAGMGVLVIALGAAAIVAAMFLRQRLGPILAARRSTAASIALRRPLSRFDATDRRSIREWFEYLAFRWLGNKASVRHHKAIVETLRDSGRSEAEPAANLARLYEEARYTPPSDPLSSDAVRNAAASYERLMKGS